MKYRVKQTAVVVAGETLKQINLIILVFIFFKDDLLQKKGIEIASWKQKNESLQEELGLMKQGKDVIFIIITALFLNSFTLLCYI